MTESWWGCVALLAWAFGLVAAGLLFYAGMLITVRREVDRRIRRLVDDDNARYAATTEQDHEPVGMSSTRPQ